MTVDTDPKLLERCAASMESDPLDPGDAAALRRWWEPQRERADALVQAFGSQPVEHWTT